jgi:hypothetical protein
LSRLVESLQEYDRKQRIEGLADNL